jgi:uncharacterized membrane protein
MSDPVLLSPEQREKGLHEAFEISVIVKGIGAASEALVGALLLLSNNAIDIVRALVENQLVDDPDGFLATHFSTFLAPTPEAQHFGGVYLLTHGVVKLALVIGLLRDKLWAYPASLLVFALFIVYQVDRYFQTHSLWLLFLTVVDLVIMWLVWHEYRHRLAKVSGVIQL